MTDMRDERLEPVEMAGTDTTKRRALDLIEATFDEADDEGLPMDAVAHAALFAAITTLVECFGEECVSQMVGTIPDKILSGGYTLSRTLQ